MSDKKRKFFSGRSIEQAVMAAASYYGLVPEELAYREIEKKHGFVRVRRNAVIAVDPENPRKSAAAPKSEAAEREAAPSRQERREEPREERLRRGRGGRRDEGAAKPETAAHREPEPAPEPEIEPEPDEAEEEARETESATPGWWHAPKVGRAGEDEDGDVDEKDEAADERERARRVDRSEGLTRRRDEGGRADESRPARRGGPDRGSSSQGRGGEDESRRSRKGRGRGRRDRQEEPPQPEPPRERPAPRSERLPRLADEELEDAVLDALDLLLGFVDVEAEAELFRNDERIEVELYGPDDHILLEDDGQLLLAMEHLLPRMLRGLYGDAFPVRVDCADFHFEREERLREVARRAADEVRRRGKPRTLDEMDPAERRIVHISLADDPSVETESVGSGYYKRLKIIPR